MREKRKKQDKWIHIVWFPVFGSFEGNHTQFLIFSQLPHLQISFPTPLWLSRKHQFIPPLFSFCYPFAHLPFKLTFSLWKYQKKQVLYSTIMMFGWCFCVDCYFVVVLFDDIVQMSFKILTATSSDCFPYPRLPIQKQL